MSGQGDLRVEKNEIGMGYDLKWCSSGIWVTFFGEASIGDLDEINEEIVGNMQGDRMRFQLMDYSRAQRVIHPAAKMKLIAYLDRALIETLRLGSQRIYLAVVEDPECQIKTGFEAYAKVVESSQWVPRLFKERAEAINWLEEMGYFLDAKLSD
ncbi:MAG: hypothetical protein ACFCU4_01265 [Puniceicoccaceae bacterium]